MSAALMVKAIAGAVSDAAGVEVDCSCHRTTQAAALHIAEAVLALPEMQAIYEALRILSLDWDLELDLPGRGLELPESVICWALDWEDDDA